MGFTSEFFLIERYIVLWVVRFVQIEQLQPLISVSRQPPMDLRRGQYWAPIDTDTTRRIQPSRSRVLQAQGLVRGIRLSSVTLYTMTQSGSDKTTSAFLPSPVTPERQIVGRDFWLSARKLISHDAGRATGHCPSQRSVTCVQMEIVEVYGTDNRRTVRGHRPQSAPECRAR